MTAVSKDPVSAYDRIDLTRLSVVVGQFSGGDDGEIERHLDILGITNAKITHDYDRVVRSVDGERADVLVCDMTTASEKGRNLIRGIRNQDIGSNPFLVMISIIEPTATLELPQTINAGPDDLVVAPFNRDVFVRKVHELAFNRRKFVAVSSYIGPTRRSSTRPGCTTAEEFEVPNPVRSTGTGIPKDELWKQISNASRALNRRKLNCDVAMIRSLVDEIIPDYGLGVVTDDFVRRIGLLNGTIDSVHRRAERLGADEVMSLCDIAENVIGEIQENPIPPNTRHLKAMPKLVEGFETALISLTGRIPTN